jgi:uncharacterized protein (DUF1015 family)
VCETPAAPVPTRSAIVPEFLPFPGIRYDLEPEDPAAVVDLSRVSAPPYDVIEPEERAALLESDPHNAVRLILPNSYAEATATLRSWQDEGVLVPDNGPTFSVYRMTFEDGGHRRSTTGVVGALALDRRDVMAHERTLPKAKSDRLELLRATRANLDPIWGLSLASGLSGLLDTAGVPAARSVDPDGSVHELWRIDQPDRLAAVSEAVGGARMVLADGHHRFETACTYSDERGDEPGVGHIMALVVELIPEQLCVRAIHRLLFDEPAGGLRPALAASFEVVAVGDNDPQGVAELESRMAGDGALGLVDADGVALLVPRPELSRAMTELPEPLREVDAARFDVGIRALLPDRELVYRHDGGAVAAHVARGTAPAAVLLRPVSVGQIRAAAAAGLRMPEKTTFFAPKPRTGMVFRSLDR